MKTRQLSYLSSADWKNLLRPLRSRTAYVKNAWTEWLDRKLEEKYGIRSRFVTHDMTQD